MSLMSSHFSNCPLVMIGFLGQFSQILFERCD